MQSCKREVRLIRQPRINKTMRFSFILLLLLAAPLLVRTQETASSRPLVNDDIVQLSRARVIASVIIEKIKTSQCKFETSPSALVALKQAGVADEFLLVIRLLL
jgi:hypothetical protein